MHGNVTVLLLALFVALRVTVDARACTVDVSPVSFGTVDLDRINRSNGRIDLECPVDTTAEIAISGQSVGSLRAMSGPGGHLLYYQLAADSGFRRLWGDGGSSGDPVRVGLYAGQRVRVPVYGVVPAQPGVPEGDYSDQLVVTITY